MISQETVFILGAGSSNEFGLPLGGELAAKIAAKCDLKFDGPTFVGAGDRFLYEEIKLIFKGRENDVFPVARRIHAGIQFCSSIDDFLDLNNGDEMLVVYGKATIARCILDAERASPLFVEDPMSGDLGDVASTWLAKFTKMVAKGTNKAALERIFDNITFINFNYDRCMEQFFRFALRALYDITDSKALELVQNLRVVRPYGHLGPMTGSGSAIPFGFSGYDFDWRHVGQTLKTYTEQVDSQTFADIESAINRASRVVFLGFGFHAQNMKILTPSVPTGNKRIIATAIGIGQDDQMVVRNKLTRLGSEAYRVLMGNEMRLLPGTSSAQLLDEYRMTLTEE